MSGMASRIAETDEPEAKPALNPASWNKVRAHRIAAAGHHLQRRFVRQRLHRGGLRLHLVSSLGVFLHCEFPPAGGRPAL